MSALSGGVSVELDQQLRWCLEMFDTLQKENGSSIQINGGNVTSPEMTQTGTNKNKANCALDDWSFTRDDVEDDVIARNLDNNCETKQWKKEKKQTNGNRKSSFSLFGKFEKKGKDQRTSVPDQDDADQPVDRRPKRFFSQQNLRMSADESGFDGCASPRSSTSRFLRILSSNQKHKSTQDLPQTGMYPSRHQSIDLNQNPVSVPRASSLENTFRRSQDSLDCEGYEYHGPENESGLVQSRRSSSGCRPVSMTERDLVQGRTRSPSWSGGPGPVVASHLSFSPPQSNYNSQPFLQRQRPSYTGNEFSSTRCLADYRPRLNTHYEEPSTGVLIENTRTDTMVGMNVRANRCIQSLSDLTGQKLSTVGQTLYTDSYSNGSVPRLAVQSSSDSSPYESTIDSTLVFRNVEDFDDSVAPSHFEFQHLSSGSSRTDRHHLQSSTEWRLTPESCTTTDTRSLHIVEDNNVFLDNSHGLHSVHEPVPNCRLSPECNGSHSFTQNANVSYINSFTMPRNIHQTQIARNHYFDKVPEASRRNLENVRNTNFSNVDDDYLGNVPNTHRPCQTLVLLPSHSRSLSMSHLQNASYQNTDNAGVLRGSHGTGGTITWRNHTQGPVSRKPNSWSSHALEKSPGFNKSSIEELRCGSDSVNIIHRRGNSLDSRCTSYATPPCFNSYMNNCSFEDQVFLDQEVSSSPKRRSSEVPDRPVRCKFFQRPINNTDEHCAGERCPSTTKELQQQAMISLFQKLTLLRQQKNQSSSNSSLGGSDSKWYTPPTTTIPLENPKTDNGLSNWKPRSFVQTDLRVFPDDLEDLSVAKSMRGDDIRKAGRFRSHTESSEEHPTENFKPSDQDICSNASSKQSRTYFKASSYTDSDSGQGSLSHAESTGQGQIVSEAKSLEDSNITLGVRTTSSGELETVTQSTPPALPPKAYSLQDNFLAFDNDEEGNHDGLRSSSGEFFYASRLRQEARKLSKSTSSLRSSSTFKNSLDETTTGRIEPNVEDNCDDLGEMNEVFVADGVAGQSPQRVQSESEAGVLLVSENARLNPNSSTNSESNLLEAGKPENGENTRTAGQHNTEIDTRAPTECNGLRITNGHKNSQKTEEKLSKPGECSFPIVADESHASSDFTTVPAPSSTRSVPDVSSVSCKALPARRNGSTTQFVLDKEDLTGDVAHSLRGLPDYETSSKEEESFRSLASILCRHVWESDEELHRILRPVCVKSSSELVRRIFEDRKLPETDPVFQSVAHQGNFRVPKTASATQQIKRTPLASLETIKDELLVLVEKKLQRQTDKKQHLHEREEEDLVLEKKVTDVVRSKVDLKQFEKFVSYLDQLEKLLQLLLNLSSRLSTVEKDLCQLPENNNGETEQKRLFEKRRQIIVRIQEASELKKTIDVRSQQVCAHLNDHLSQTEYQDFLRVIQNRCQLMLQRQAAEDNKELVVLRQRIITGRCQTAQHEVKSLPSTKDDSEYICRL